MLVVLDLHTIVRRLLGFHSLLDAFDEVFLRLGILLGEVKQDINILRDMLLPEHLVIEE